MDPKPSLNTRMRRHGSARALARASNARASAPRWALLAAGLSAGLLLSPSPVEPAQPIAAQPPSESSDAPADEGVGPRQSELVDKRRAKASRAAPYQPSWLERLLLRFEKAESPPLNEVNLWGAYPRFRSFDHRSKWALGGQLWKPDLAGSALDLGGAAFASLRGFRYYDAQLGLLPHRGRSLPLLANRTDDVFELPNVRHDDNRRLMLYGSYSYRRAPRLDFWGTGMEVGQEDRVAFRQQDTLCEFVGGYRVRRWLTLGARAGYSTTSLGPAEDDDLPRLETRYTDATAPGLARQPDFWRLGTWAVADTRDVAGNPHRGALVALLWTRHDDRGSGAHGFDRVAVDGRVYLPLGHAQRVLALRTYFSQDEPGDSGRVPFYLQASLGSSRTLRADDSQRFRGERLLLLQGEYRIEAAPPLELALFADAGAVAARRDGAIPKLRTDWGVGLRVKNHETVLVRLDAAWGEDGFRLRLRFSPVF